MNCHGWLRQSAHMFEAVFGLAQAGQASALTAMSFKQALHIVSWSLLGLEHKKQRLPEKIAAGAQLTLGRPLRLTANPLRI